MFNPLKVKAWLKFRNPDFVGFKEHLEALKKSNIDFGIDDIVILAKNYNLPEPNITNGEINLKLTAQPTKVTYSIPITISPTKTHGK